MSDSTNATPTIIVADDVEVCRAFVSQTLINAGYNVVEAGNGREALDAIRAGKNIALAVLDVEMPEMDGLLCLKELRADPKFIALPVMLLTAKADRNFIMQAKELKANQYLLKSEFRAPDLLARVSKCLLLAAPLKRSA
jgi:two-component system chemotaxis response regulator CheY